MNVTVKCFATLSDDTRCTYDQARDIRLDTTKASAGTLAEVVAIAPQDIALIFVNGRRAELGTPLTDGDRVAFAPAVGGM